MGNNGHHWFCITEGKSVHSSWVSTPACLDSFNFCLFDLAETSPSYLVIEAAHVAVELSDEEYILAHGASRFLKFEKVQDLKRKGRTGDAACLYVF